MQGHWYKRKNSVARRIIDLSVPIANDIPADPPIQIPPSAISTTSRASAIS
jgi:hypothetical protein